MNSIARFVKNNNYFVLDKRTFLAANVLPRFFAQFFLSEWLLKTQRSFKNRVSKLLLFVDNKKIIFYKK
jgi:hypothetical protein